MEVEVDNKNKIIVKKVIEDQIDVQWSKWALKHPHLSDYIDRHRLIELTMDEIDHDEQIQELLESLIIEEHQLKSIQAITKRISEKLKNCIGFIGA